MIKSGVSCLLETQSTGNLNKNILFSDLSALSELQGKYSPSVIIDYQKILLLGAEILIKIRAYDYAETLLELSKAKNLNEAEYLYYVKLIFLLISRKD